MRHTLLGMLVSSWKWRNLKFYKIYLTHEGSIVESADFSREDQRGGCSLHCLDEGAEAGTGGEKLGGDVVAARLPLGSTWMYPVFCQCSKHKGICRV